MEQRISNDVVDAIKSRITAREVFEYYGIPVNARGFALCPFHGEKTPSLRVYDGDRGFHCFGCGAGGDVIDFTRKYFGISFSEACIKLNSDFGLGCRIGQRQSVRSLVASGKKAFEARKKREAKESKIKSAEEEYYSILDRFIACEKIIKEKRPTSDGEICEEFITALCDYEKIKYELSAAELRWTEEERRRTE